MPFLYVMKPNPASSTHPYTTRPDFQPTMTEDELLGKVAALHGRDRALISEVIGDLFAVLRDAARDTRSVEAIGGHFRTQPTSGGIFDDPGAPVNPRNAGVSYSLILTRDEIAAVQNGLVLQSSGLVGGREPSLDTVRVMPTGEVNAYHPGGGLEARGQYLRDGANGTLPTAELIDPAGANPVPLSVFDATEGRILLAVPATGVSRPRRLRITATLNGTPMIAHYQPTLNPV